MRFQTKAIILGLVVFARPVLADVGEILSETGIQGGLVVHVECGDGKLASELRAGDSYLVEGLDTDAENVDKARRLFESLGLGGKVTAVRFDGKRPPAGNFSCRSKTATSSARRGRNRSWQGTSCRYPRP